jgi:endoglucanase
MAAMNTFGRALSPALWIALLLPVEGGCSRPIPHPPTCPADCARAPAPPPAERQPAASFVHREGLGLVDENGSRLTLRGVNLGGWLLWEGWIWGAKLHLLSGWGHAESAIEERLAEAAGTDTLCRFRDAVRDRFITEADITAIAGAGFNVVRVPLNHRDFDCDGSPGWVVLDRLLDWCEAHNVYAVLELHSAPGGQMKYFVSDPEPVLLWDSPEARDRTVTLWRSLARRYAGRAIVAGYDLLGEPKPSHDDDLVDLDRRIVAAIREVDTHHMLIVEGTDFARDFSMFTRPLDPNQIYSFHMYTWFGDDRKSRLQSFAKVATAQGVPMWCGEFGENTLPMLTTTLDLFDAESPALVGWSFWTWKRTASSSGWATLHGISLPAGWNALIEWAVNDEGRRPLPEDARRSMDQFLDASAFTRLTTDPQLRATLSAHARR